MHPKADEAAREKHQLDIALLKGEGRPIVYIDESGFEVDSCRDQGYTKRGQRCKDTKDWQAKGRINAIGALLAGVLLTIALFTGTINSDVFYQWIVDDLLPKLPKNAVLVMDNASFHKRDDIQKALRGAGFDLLFLPPYSPDFNPIEKKWAQSKMIRKEKRCDPETLFRQYVV